MSLCECGCGCTTATMPYTCKSRGWIKGESYKFVHGHNRRKKGNEYEVDPVTGCWNWLLGLSSGRYGNRNNIAAHRRYYELYKGKIPENWEIDHLCFNTRCVNPEHLEAVTHSVNMSRRFDRERALYGNTIGGRPKAV